MASTFETIFFTCQGWSKRYMKQASGMAYIVMGRILYWLFYYGCTMSMSDSGEKECSSLFLRFFVCFVHGMEEGCTAQADFPSRRPQ